MTDAEKSAEVKQAEALAEIDRQVREARDRRAHRQVVKLVGSRQYKKLRRTALNELEAAAQRKEGGRP